MLCLENKCVLWKHPFWGKLGWDENYPWDLGNVLCEDPSRCFLWNPPGFSPLFCCFLSRSAVHRQVGKPEEVLWDSDQRWSFLHQISDEIGLKGIWTKPAAPQRIWKEVQKVKHICELNRLIIVGWSWTELTFCWSFWQNKAFVAVWALHGGKICSKLCHIGAPWTPAHPSSISVGSLVVAPALEVPFLLDTLLSL